MSRNSIICDHRLLLDSVIPVCQFCHEEGQCIFQKYKNYVLKCIMEGVEGSVEDYEATQFDEEDCYGGRHVVGLHNNQLRHLCYKAYSRLLHGALGEGNHVPLPVCVEEGVCGMYPDTNGVYKGFCNRTT